MRIAFKICKQWLLALLSFPKTLSSLLDEKNAENTKTAINVFRQYLEARDLKGDDVL